jgi:hypothetical protein
MKLCSIEGCPHPHRAKSYCILHYSRFKAHGDPHKVLPKGNPIGFRKRRGIFLPSDAAMDAIPIEQVELLIKRARINIAKRRASRVTHAEIKAAFDKLVILLDGRVSKWTGEVFTAEKLSRMPWCTMYQIDVGDDAVAMQVRHILNTITNRRVNLQDIPIYSQIVGDKTDF